MIEKLKALPKELGRAKRILADNGYLSEANVEQCEAAKIEPLIALGRSLPSCDLEAALCRRLPNPRPTRPRRWRRWRID